VEPRGFLLVDSGGQYLEGTTDITRTIACGPLTGKEKEFYTRVLRGCLNLGAARFLYGCTGMAFDYLARQPLWEIGADYNHGTGHGVGFLLNVHEGPNSFSYKIMQGRPLPCVLEEGMITSDEPGIYFEGEFGVRCENLMLCVKDEKNAYGQFMHFDTLTMVPWELDAVVPDLLNEREKELLNAYHAKVYEQISPYLKGAEKEWLREATRAI
jgi:Xaa-Pro aminopeptidase